MLHQLKWYDDGLIENDASMCEFLASQNCPTKSSTDLQNQPEDLSDAPNATKSSEDNGDETSSAQSQEGDNGKPGEFTQLVLDTEKYLDDLDKR